jgi:predicted  nucleic acid-binding Zn-ribbon protein
MRRVREFTVRIQTLRRRFDRERRKLDTSTQTVREALIVDLEEAFTFAKERLYAVRKEAHKQYWARVMAYIAQTLAYVTKEYDLSKINDKIVELQKKFLELKKKLLEQAGYVS